MALAPYAAAPALARLLGWTAANPVARELAAAGSRYAWNAMKSRFPGVRQTAMARYGGNRGGSRPSTYARMGQMKWIDFTATGTAFAATNGVLDLTTVPQDTTASGRIGNRVIMKSIQYRIIQNLNAQVTGTDGGFQYRYMFVLDRQANGAAMTGANMLVADTSYSPLNLTKSQRFKVLKTIEGTHNYTASYLNAAGAASTLVTNTKEFKGFIKCNIPVEFSGTAGAISEIQTNCIWLVFAADGIGTAPTFSHYIRLRYDDPVR